MILAKLAGLALAASLLADPFRFEFSGQTNPRGEAHLVLFANEPMPAIEIEIEGDGRTLRKQLPKLAAGKSHKITWKQDASLAHYKLTIRSAKSETDFEFDVQKAVAGGAVGKLSVLSDRDEIVGKHRVRYKTSFALSNYEFKVYDTAGDVIADGLVTDAVSPGGTFEVKWDSEEDVFMVYVRGEDDLGRYTEYKLVPWSVEIPHTEVNFDSGKHDIKGDEAWKVEEAVAVAFHELVALDKVNKAVGANLQPMLYIVGYTDTVGNPSKNQVLSEDRAKAIARFFYDAGFWSEIYYAGMGERGLRVPTGDSVDEVKNRRASYILAVQPPAPGGAMPGRWQKLADARTPASDFQLPPLPERWAKKKGGSQGSSSGDASTASDRDDGDGGRSSASENASEGGGGDPSSSYPEGAPPPSEATPGATAKGCNLSGAASQFGWFGIVVAAGAVRRRRLPRSTSGI